LSDSTHWLEKAARVKNPGVVIPPGVAISPVLSEAWRQVASVFQISSAELASCVAQAFGLSAGSITDFQPGDPSVLPEQLCRELRIVQLSLDENTACIGISDPRLSPEQLTRLRFVLHRNVKLSVLPPDDIDTCLTRHFSGAGSPRSSKTSVIDLVAGTQPGQASQTVKLACALLRKAIDSKASDVHIHPFVGGGVIRFRVDGQLRRIATVPMESLESLSRFFKAQAGLETNPLKPQDGRLRLAYGRREIDVRLSILPAYDGDRIVCRLLDQSRNFSLQHSHFSTADQQVLRRMTNNSAGIVLLTGPTGSGKTSTLYALLTELNTVDFNIMTIEDPVEYVLPGISQVQVNEKQGLSFADTLRSILRQDPDIVLVGEIRDGETARIAAQAALTGHLVLSTLHTNDALGTLPRLLDLGLDRSVLADSLMGAVSQRLVRRLCESCRQPAQAPYLPIEAEFHRLTGEFPSYRTGGCQACNFVGYKGRLPIIESVEFSPALRQAIVSGEQRVDELKRIAGGQRRSMATSAKDWIVSGLTTPTEVQYVLGIGFWRELATEHGFSPESLSGNLAQVARPGQRMKILVLTKDRLLGDKVTDGLSYAVSAVADEEAANDYLQQQHDVIGLVIDSALAEAPLETWLSRLRTKLAWTGLPTLFVISPQQTALKALLDQFDAPCVEDDEQQPQALREALTRVLQG
jgi:type IV pilus assembly protein PilB